jgi:hypothetical protein
MARVTRVIHRRHRAARQGEGEGAADADCTLDPEPPLQAVIMRHVATNVREAVVAGSGHWLMEERPAESVALIRSFLDSPGIAAPVNSLAPR